MEQITHDRIASEKLSIPIAFMGLNNGISIGNNAMKLTQARLKELLDYDPETGVFVYRGRILSRNRKSLLEGRVAGCKSPDGYLAIGIDRKTYRVHRLAWLYMYGYLPENDIDHVNRIKTDNRIKNLREVSRQCNARNCGNWGHNTSGVKGVTLKDTTGRWAGRIMINQKSYHLGYYKDFDNAVCARLAAEQCVGWPGCDKNSPAFRYVKEMILNGK